MAALTFVVVLLVVASAAPAHAATVTMNEGTDCPYKGECYPYQSLHFVAQAGEANDLTVAVDGRAHTFTDTGAQLTAGAGCRATDAHTVVCTLEHLLLAMRIELGDGDDRAHAPPLARLEGGDGNDVLAGGTGYGGAGDDTISGPGFHEAGPGHDRIVGGGDAGPGDDVLDATVQTGWVSKLGPGRDIFIGGDGDDWVEDFELEDPARDRMDGGGGRDTLGYGGSPVALTVDLAAPSQAAAHDDVTGFERVIGSNHDDVLTGSGGPDEFWGGGGDDVLVGRGGDDDLRGDEGADRIDGGPGDDFGFGGSHADVIALGEGDDRASTLADHHRDRVDCGPGRDAGQLDDGDRRAGCEQLELRKPERVLGYGTPIISTRKGRWRITYQSCESWPSCRGTSRMVAHIGGRALRLPTVRFRGSRLGAFPRSGAFRLPPKVAAHLRRTGLLRIDVTTLMAPGETAGVLPARQRVWLRARPRKAASDR